MEGSSSHPRPPDLQLPSTPTLYQVPQSAAGRSHYRSVLQGYSQSSSPAPTSVPTSVPTFPTPCPPNYHLLYSDAGAYITPPFVPGLDPVVDPLQLQPRIAHGQSSVIPGWQPDNLVRNCPICDTPFTFLFRRHHCRQCGRVVCAQCSSHRLTLPSSAVVRPPTEVFIPDDVGVQSPQWSGGHNYNTPSSSLSNRYSWAGSNNSREECSPGVDWRTSEDKPVGLEDVRVCSDCYSGVPDQNDHRDTPGSGSSIHRTWNGTSSSTTQARPSASGIWVTPGLNTAEPNGRRQSFQGERSLPCIFNPSTQTLPHSSRFCTPQVPGTSSIYTLPSTIPTTQSLSISNFPSYSLTPHAQAKYGGFLASQERLNSPSSQQIHNTAHFTAHGHPYLSTASQHTTSPHPQPLRASSGLKETDYCPICTLPLPPPHPEMGDKSAAEAHIEECIRVHEVSRSPPTAPTSSTNITRVAGGMNMIGVLQQSDTGSAKYGSRMVVYHAKEEDTWDYSTEGEQVAAQAKNFTSGDPSVSNTVEKLIPSSPFVKPHSSARGNLRRKAECVICFEEFEIGDAIARLECLCRYHKHCIWEWFDRKGNGDCPIHAIRE